MNIKYELFSEELQSKVAEKFLYLNQDHLGNERLFLENAGGSLRLNSVVEEQKRITAIPDSPSDRKNEAAQELTNLVNQGKKDISLFLNAENGTIAASLTASKILFEIITMIASESEEGNIVTTEIEHPSSFDACKFSSEKYNHELRVAKADPDKGNIPLNNILELIDPNTKIISLILTSNLTGAMHDMEKYSKAIRNANPNAYIVVDAVQGAPHEVIDIDNWEVDAINIAPYKMFGNRGVGFAWMSDKVAELPHHRLLATELADWDLGSKTPSNFACFTKIIDHIVMIGKHFNESNDRRTLIEEGMTRIHSHEKALLNRLLYGTKNTEGIKALPDVKVHFAEENKENQDFILALDFEKIDNSKAVEFFEEHGIIVYAREATNHYSQRILSAVNLDSIVRVSPLHCNSPEDIDKFLKVTKTIVNA